MIRRKAAAEDTGHEGGGHEGGDPAAGLSPSLAEGAIFELRVRAQARRLYMVRALVSTAAEDAGCSAQASEELVSAVDEAFQNVIRHAYKGQTDGCVVLRASREEDKLVLRMIDFAEPVDPETISPRPLDELRPGGIGTRVIRACVDEVSFETPPPGAGNCLRLAKRII